LRFVLARGQTEDNHSLDARGREIIPLPLASQTNQPGGATEILLDGGNLPIDHLFLKTTDRNFRRAVSVQVPGTDDSWRTIHQTHLHRFEVGDFRDERLFISLPETRAERWRLLIENGANAPVTFSSITGQGPAYEILFLADPGDDPVVYLGGNDTPLTNALLDTAAIRAAIRREVPAETVEASEALPNPSYRAVASEPAGPGLLDSQPALWSIIALAVAVLIAVVYQAMRKIEEKPDGTD
jgi:hypothetical protein